MLACFYYLNNTRLVPRYMLQGRTARYVVTVALSFILYLASHAVVIAQIEQVRVLAGDPPGPMARGSLARSVPAVIFFVVIGLWSSTQAMAEAYRKLRASREASRQALVEMELDRLRSQVDPHFFFNALNTIYGLAELKDDRTGQATLHLGRLMRHTLEAPRMQLIPLADEVGHLQAYIAFQELRSTAPPVRLAVEGVQPDMRIAPLLLIPLVENAFKHGPTSAVHEATHINVIVREAGELSLTVTNILGPGPPLPGSGLGLSNLRRRLSLEYPGAHALTIEQDGQRFSARLHIELDHAVHSHRR